ncbi:MAG: hypothetical protein L0Y38_05975 [Methylococcaceae bacterium]|nr:hypothetical protein [Methylococcaceae bacterium]MCI0668698.1 hypothetical protein [Methylococcaceae bacterium]MCI0733353.1 hypothetical protein [Methylococcaceae bacterium]
MRIDAVFVLALGAISYLQFMLQLYDNLFVALGVFLVSGFFGVWMGLSFGEPREEAGQDRSG